MSLEEYKKKRDFKKTPEPSKNVRRTGGKRIFVIQEHNATNLHWDLRLELDGVLKSWAIPKTPPTKPGIKRLAVQTEDHPLSYANFQGAIPEGEYGAGTVTKWDGGEMVLLKRDDNSIHVNLFGEKMKGLYILVKFKAQGKSNKNWLFFKKKKT
jgi:DNA ligase D-like protein (predicted 3'-phosphoesterase)